MKHTFNFRQASILTRRLTTKVIKNYMLVFFILLTLMISLLFPVLIRHALKSQDEYSSFIAEQYEQMISSIQVSSRFLTNDSELADLLISYSKSHSVIDLSKIEAKLQYYLSAFPEIMYCMIETEDGTIFESFSNTNTDARQLYLTSSERRDLQERTNSTVYSEIITDDLFSTSICSHSLFVSQKLTISGYSCVFTIFYNVDAYVSNSITIMEDVFSDYFVLDRNFNLIYSCVHSLDLNEVDFLPEISSKNDPYYDILGVFYSKRATSVGWYVFTYSSWTVFLQDILIVGGIVLLFYLLPPIFFYMILVPANQKYLQPLSVLTRQISNYTAGQKLTIDIHTGDEIEQLSTSVNLMIDKINNQIIDIKKKERENYTTQYSLLATQIDPHFIYNTLNIVNIMARQIGQESIIEVITALGKILRERFSTESSIFETVESSLDTIKQYYTIMKYRYKNDVEITIDAETSILDKEIPRNLLLPIIENAYYHGLSSDDGDIHGKISIYIYSIANEIVIEISDNGAGISPEKIAYLKNHKFQTPDQDRTHIGLSNLYKRLYYIYEDSFTIDINSALGAGSTFSITIPSHKNERTDTAP